MKVLRGLLTLLQRSRRTESGAPSTVNDTGTNLVCWVSVRSDGTKSPTYTGTVEQLATYLTHRR